MIYLKDNLKLGIIGTSFRGTDESRLNINVWNEMLIVAKTFIPIYNIKTLVSGGAAGGDSVATTIFLNNTKLNYELFLPAALEVIDFDETTKDGSVANYYHRKFSQKLGRGLYGTLDDLISLQNKENCKIVVNKGGFKARNTDVARESDVLLAFTYGDGAKLKVGGTSDTVTKYFDFNKQECYHYCLNTRELHKISKI